MCEFPALCDYVEVCTNFLAQSLFDIVPIEGYLGVRPFESDKNWW